MKRNKIFKNCIKLIMISMLISISVYRLFENNLKVSATSNTKALVSTKKIYSHTDIEENFDDSSVIVIIDRINSGINKSHKDTIFKDIELLEIVDLTHVNDITTIKDLDNFEQILKIKLIESGKQKVIDMINRLSLIDGIKYAGPNRTFEVDRTPNDPLYSPITSVKGQWCHKTLQSEKAWDITTGSSSVRIGVIDTGISNHPDLIDNLAPGLDFYNIVGGKPGVARTDPTGHGTHVAGIIGATGNQTPAIGVAGVNWDVTIVPMQVANNTYSGEIDSDACVRAINYARDIWNTSERISILNMCISGDKEWPEIETAIRNYQGLVVCSTGNTNQDTDVNHRYPSFYGSDMHTNPLQNLISVGRSDINDRRPVDKDANWGKRTIMLFSPGQDILSTYPEELCNGIIRNTAWGDLLSCECTQVDFFGTTEWVPNFTTHHSKGYHYNSGSSMATPQVSGVAALLLSINPNLTTQQLKTAILETVDIPNIGGSNPLENECVTGGRLNAYNAVKFVLSNYSSSTNLKYGTKTLSKTIDSTSTFFNEKNYFLKMNVENAYEYDFTISSSSALEVALYDSNSNKINVSQTSTNGGLTKTFSYYLSVGTYYLKSNYVSSIASGTINVSIAGEPHTHSYTGWLYYDRISHIERCVCGQTGTRKQAHSISQADLHKPKAKCLGCKALLDLGGDGDIVLVPGILSTNITIITENGSYVLPSGIIVLVEEDIEAYLNGTLIFYDEDETLVTQ